MKSIPIPDAKLTTEAELVERLTSVVRQRAKLADKPLRPGRYVTHYTTQNRENAAFAKLAARIDDLSTRLRQIRREKRDAA